MKSRKLASKKQFPEMFRPLLWWAKWKDLDADEDKEDIIVSAVNEGTLAHWRWIIKTYGRAAIRRILEKRLGTEFHRESQNLAKIIFSVSDFLHARESAH